MIEALDQVVVLKVNGKIGDGVQLAKEQGVAGYPTFVVLDADAQPIRSWIGYYDAASFVENLSAAVADPVSIPARMERLSVSPTEKDAAVIGLYHLQRLEIEQGLASFAQARELAAPPGTGYEREVLRLHLLGASRGAADLEGLAGAAQSLIELDGTSFADAAEAALSSHGHARKADRAELTTPLVLEVLARADSEQLDDDGRRLRDELQIIRALEVDNQPELALSLKQGLMGDGWEDDPERLNEFAWWCFENKLNLEPALALARKGAGAATEPSLRAATLDTVAEICFALGRKDEAVAAIREAITEEPETDYFKQQLQRFQGEQASAL